jgi:hypothetical protein
MMAYLALKDEHPKICVERVNMETTLAPSRAYKPKRELIPKAQFPKIRNLQARPVVDKLHRVV